MFCGTEDLLSSEKDFRWMRDVLEENGSLTLYKEYALGHLGLLMPAEDNFQDIFDVLAKFNDKC